MPRLPTAELLQPLSTPTPVTTPTRSPVQPAPDRDPPAMAGCWALVVSRRRRLCWLRERVGSASAAGREDREQSTGGANPQHNWSRAGRSHQSCYQDTWRISPRSRP